MRRVRRLVLGAMKRNIPSPVIKRNSNVDRPPPGLRERDVLFTTATAATGGGGSWTTFIVAYKMWSLKSKLRNGTDESAGARCCKEVQKKYQVGTRKHEDLVSGESIRVAVRMDTPQT